MAERLGGGDRLEAAAAAIARGEVVAVPTDTVYGLAADPANPAALDAVYALKRRPAGLEIGLLGADRADLEPFAVIGGAAARLAGALWPGAVSLVVPARAPRTRLAVPLAGSTLSVRVPDHPLLRRLLARTGVLAVTSANRHGEAPAVDAAGARSVLGDAAATVVDGGRAGGVASTVVDCTAEPPVVLRPGALDERALRRVLAAGG